MPFLGAGVKHYLRGGGGGGGSSVMSEHQISLNHTHAFSAIPKSFHFSEP